jgi:hypothetical protein
MRYWTVALATSLLIVVIYAAGPLGALVSLLVFSFTLFLVWASRLGFEVARKRFAISKISSPVFSSENRNRLEAIFSDSEAVLKAGTASLVVVALSLTLPIGQVVLVVAVVGAFFSFQIANRHKKAS